MDSNKSKTSSEIIKQVSSSDFSKYDDENRFYGKTLKEVLDAYVADRPNLFTYRFTCNSDMPLFDQLKNYCDTDQFDYVCLQAFDSDGTLVFFSVNKKTNEVLPFGLGLKIVDEWVIRGINDKVAVISFMYSLIENLMIAL